ncbi:ankyrin-3 [Aplysia californica]|uniref:Ankyrin-3 n=1 Tax=Aplysia californica TaxID=6500 RepID=A0ABM1VUV0_APLCA|nr:ankyrin-3 [Aplysia californica]
MSSSSRAQNNAGGKAGFDKREKRRNIRRLQSAITDKDIQTVTEILCADFDVDFQYNSQTSLQLAVCCGALEICVMLIQKGANVNQADANGNSLLNMACWRGFAEVAQLLVDSGAELDTQNELGNTSLNVCALKGFEKIAKILLKAGCDANLANKKGLNPLHTVCQAGCLPVVESLLSSGADLDWIDFSHRTPLMMAAEAGHVSVVTALLQAGCKVDCQSRQGHTAALEAAATGNVDVLTELVRFRANLDLGTTKGLTPLLAAISQEHSDIAELLVRSGCDVNLADRRQDAPLHVLIRQISSMFMSTDGAQRHKLVYALVDAGADVNKSDAEGCTPLYQALLGGDVELCQYLLRRGASVTALTSAGSSILHAAVYSGRLDVLKLCLDAGCAVNVVNKSGQHALLAAVSSRCDIQILRQLLSAGSEVNVAQSHDLHTALHQAVCQHYEAAAKLFIDHGSDLAAMTKEKKTPLYLACARGLTDTVTYMLSKDGCPLSSEFPSALPIHAASTHGRSGCIQVLAQYGCDLNQMNEKGETPIMAALAEDSFTSARALLQWGCDLDYQHKVRGLQLCCLHQEDAHPHLGLEPLFLAMTHKNLDMLKMLLACYRSVPRRTIHLLAMLLRKTQALTVHYSEKQKADILRVFSHSLRTPFSLSDACRRCIRACLSSPLEARADALPIARKMKSYLLMTEEFEAWREMEQEMPGGSSGFSDVYVKKERW